jgi:hypothetical protein
MMVRRGWSIDYAKKKFDVELDENDLQRMLAERGVPDPAALAARMSTHHVYLALDAEAMAFVHDTLRRMALELGKNDEAQDHLRKLQAHRAERDRILGIYAPKPAPEAEPEAA